MVYITLKTPKSIDSASVKNEMRRLISKNGKKTNEIGWRMEFTTTPELVKKISDKFSVMKNKIAFHERDKR